MPSRFCRVTQLYPGTTTSLLLVCAAYLIPALAVVAGSTAAHKMRRDGLYLAGVLIGTALLIIEAWLLTRAHLDFFPSGP